VTLAFDLLNS